MNFAIESRVGALSVIVPIGLKDQAWRDLIPDLQVLLPSDELVFAIVDDIEEELRLAAQLQHLCCKVKVVKGSKGRAKQMNLAAKSCENSYFWFLHSDSRLEPESLRTIKKILEKNSPCSVIWYFDLKFAKPRNSLMRLTELGVWLRSHSLKLPFGDQGFVMSRQTFSSLNGYSELAEFGEDHLIIWQAHQSGVSVLPLNCHLVTSARKYQSQGWWSTTGHHLRLTVSQAVPELIKFLRRRRLH